MSSNSGRRYARVKDVALTIYVIFWMSVGLGLILGVVAGILIAANALHWLVGLVVAIAFVIAVWIGLCKLRKDLYSEERRLDEKEWLSYVLGPVGMVGLAVLAITTISFGLWEADQVKYEANQPINYEVMLKYYLLHLIDSIPILEAWKAFNIIPPARPEGFWSGSLLVIFRVIIIAPITSFTLAVIAYERRQRAASA